MTEQDFIPSHFVEVNQDVVEASDSPSNGGTGATGPPEPEADASISKCSMHQADPSLE